jgi:hypothetical protein
VAGSKALPWCGDAGRLDVVVQLTVVGGGIDRDVVVLLAAF